PTVYSSGKGWKGDSSLFLRTGEKAKEGVGDLRFLWTIRLDDDLARKAAFGGSRGANGNAGSKNMLEPFLAQLSARYLDLQPEIGLRSALKRLRRRDEDLEGLVVRGAESALLDKAGRVLPGNAVEVEVGGDDLDPAKHVPGQRDHEQLAVQ